MYFNLRLWSFTRGARLRIAYAVLLGLLTAAAGVARLALLGVVLARVLSGDSLAGTLPWIAAAGFAVLARGALQYQKEMVAHTTAAIIQLKLREQVYARILELGPARLGQERSGDTMLSIVDGVEQLETFFGQYLPQLFVAALTPIGVFVFMALLDLPTAGVALGFAVFALLAPAAFHRWNRSSSMRRRKAYGEFGAEFLDSVQGLFTLKAFGQSRSRGEMLAAKAHAVFRSTMWVLASNAGSLGVTVAGIAIGAAAVLAVGADRVTTGAMSMEALLIILMLGIEVFRPLRELSQLFHQGMVGLSAAHGIFTVLDAEPLVVETPRRGVSTSPSPQPSPVKGEGAAMSLRAPTESGRGNLAPPSLSLQPSPVKG